MNSFLFYYGFGMIQTLIVIVYLSSLFFSFGIIHAYLFYWKKAWLKKVLANGNYSDEVKKSLENELEPAQPFPLYKYLKFYFSTLSVIMIISGVVTMLSNSNTNVLDGEEWMKILIFIPVIIGAIFYIIYILGRKKSGLFRELTAAFMFCGFGVSFVGFFPIYNLTFLRTDLQIYIALGFGLFVINHLKAVVTSYLYMIAIVIAAVWIPFTSKFGSEWLEFLNLFIWPFGLAILFFWIPRLEEAKKIEFREITFGVLFAIMMISLGIVSTYGFSYLSMLAIVPALYMFSLKYFKQGNWYIEKPIQTMITLAIIILSIVLSMERSGMIFRNNSYVYMNDWGIMKVFTLIIIFGIGFFAIKKYKDEFKNKSKDTSVALFCGLIVFFIASFLGELYRSDAIVFLYAKIFSIYLIYKSLKNKNEVVLTLGAFMFLILLSVKSFEHAQQNDLEKVSIGIITAMIGVILAILVIIMRSQWKVTEKTTDQNNTTLKPEREELDQI
ncbi:MAG: hypothetical protein IT222_01835 [Crocinitomix sp.]|nr:hypothetical protein [Crocinitomix sp.]